MKNKTCYSFMPYLSVCSITLDSFDNNLPDYGVLQYFDTLKFLPHILFCNEFTQDFVHMHEHTTDDSLIRYSKSNHKGWTYRQLRGLIDELHKYGVKIFLGFHGAWWSKSIWLGQHCELFITLRDGRKADNPSVFNDITRMEAKTEQNDSDCSDGLGMAGALNPLARTSGGEWYEDILCRDIISCLNDYGFDGTFLSEGMVGLSVTLNLGDYSDDMIDQFSVFSSVHVNGKNTREKADDIWENHRAEWINFYTKRWGRFYRKMSDSLKQSGKELATMDAWARGPADSIYDFGIDYLELCDAGIDYYVMQSREENWGRRGHCDPFVWEPGQIAAVTTIKTRAPKIRLLWAVSSCVAAEHWNAIRDIPNVLERQLFALPQIGFISTNGSFKRSYDGFDAHVADFLSENDWKWLIQRLSFSFSSDIQRMLGAAIVWSDNVYEKHCCMGERWQITRQISQLITAGVPIRQAVNTNCLKNADAEAYILIDPVGILEHEIDSLIEKRKNGAALILIGNIDNTRLLKELGIISAKNKSEDTRRIESENDCDQAALENCIDLNDLSYVTDTAETIVGSRNGKIVMSIQRYTQGGPAIYLASTSKWAVQITPNPSAFTEHKSGFGEPGYMQLFYDVVMPNRLEYLAAAIVKKESSMSVIVDEGQYAAFENSRGDIIVLLENMANLYYLRPKIYTSFPFCKVKEFDIKTLAPKSYILNSSPEDKVCSVHVIPDGAIPVELINAKSEG